MGLFEGRLSDGPANAAAVGKTRPATTDSSGLKADVLSQPERIHLVAFSLSVRCRRRHSRHRKAHPSVGGYVETHESGRLALEEGPFLCMHQALVTHDSGPTDQ